MDATTILDTAATIIQTNGLAKRAYVEGDPMGDLPAHKCPVCPRGAIALAVGRHPLFSVDWPQWCENGHDTDDEDRIGNEAERTARAAIISAEAAFARYIRTELKYPAAPETGDPELIELWTDEPDRTLPEVVGALRAAAQATKAGAQ